MNGGDDGERSDGWLARLVDVVDRFVPATLRDDAGQLLRARMLLLYSATVIAICPVFVGLPLAQGRRDLAAITAIAMFVGSLTGPVLRRTGSIAWAALLAVSTYGITHATLFCSAGFFDLSSLYWFMSTPMFALFLRGVRFGVGTFVVVTVASMLGALLLPAHTFAVPPGYNAVSDAIGAWFFGIILLAFGALYDVVRQRSTASLRDALRAMEAARAQAEESGQARTRLVASISHELRTPLGGVVGLAHLLEKTTLSLEQRELTALIGESADAVVALLNDLLEFARLDVGPVPVEQLPVDVARVVRGVVGLFDGREDGRVRIDIAIDDDVPALVLGDARRLRQVLWNLVGNAVKFSPLGSGAGRGHVVVRVARVARVAVATDAPATVRLCFSVQDDGPGVDDEARQRLFQPFSQARDAHRRLGGTGLGLAISRNLVRALGGDEIHLDTTIGTGSTFSFSLPFSPAPPATRPPHARVLVVEDDPVSALVARRMIEAAGLSCDVVGDGDTAVTSALAGHYDLILLDGNLPGRHGHDVARAIRAAERAAAHDGPSDATRDAPRDAPHDAPNNGASRGPRARVPIVALTATTTPDERERALDAGMDDHLHKPLDPARLTTLLREHVRARP
jgi:signal transduction histidine kinase/CheY-like chemotaxis protein